MSAELSIVIANIEEAIVDTMEKIIVSAGDNRLSSEAMIDLCVLSRQWGIGLMLLELDIDSYVAGLFKSGRTYVFLLEKAAENSHIDPYYLCRSRANPLFDAVAIGDQKSLDAIANLCTTFWREELEEEDDFCYMDFFISFLQTPDDNELLKNKLIEFERSLDGISSLRFDACVALFSKDENEYWRVIGDFLEEHFQRIYIDLQNGQLEPTFAHTEAHISIEGIALIKAGQLAGFYSAEEYPMVPSIALQASLALYPQNDPWDKLNQMLR